MASLRSPPSPTDGYKRFSDDFANASINNYGSNVSNSRAAAAAEAGAGAGGGEGSLELGSRSSLHAGLPMTEDEHWEMNYHEAAIYLESLAGGAQQREVRLAPVEPGGAAGLPARAQPLVPRPGPAGLARAHPAGLQRGARRARPQAARVGARRHGAAGAGRGGRGAAPQAQVDRLGHHPQAQAHHAQGLLMFFVATYSLLGYYLFSEHVDNGHFRTLSDSFVSMFVLLTTANFPDVMMPSYAKSKWYAVFFILYIITVLYVLMNLMLAVVYETFTRIERDKCRALLLHRRGAARRAFRLLVSRRAPRAVRLRHFAGLLRHAAPSARALDALLTFRLLNRSGSGGLSRAEFAALYDALALRWAPQAARAPWYAAGALEPLGRAAAAAVAWPHFERLACALLAANGAAMALRACQAAGDARAGARLLGAAWDAWLFAALALLEAGVRALAAGAERYLASGWNVFDLGASLLALLGAALLSLAPELAAAAALRPLRLLRLYKLKKRYRDVFGTLVLLSPLMSSAGCVMLVLYYFFAIVGMELFAGAELRDCCANTSVEEFYKSSRNGSAAPGYYYLNNFENLLTSGVTLFELTVVNNWFVLMNAYAAVVGQLSRIYFMVFYLFTMVVLTIVVASVLEAFRFRIQYKRSTSKRDEEKLLHEEVHTSWEEAQRLGAAGALADELRAQLPPGRTVSFVGTRPRTKEVLQRRMYHADILKWLAEDDDSEEAPPAGAGDAPPEPAAPPEPEAQQLRGGGQL
ncbi:two pore channel protein 1-like isoform X6 [Bicyclus anynana]|uniref:Two pore channel protein 1-like isoform X6 n=1 Tax=Bicyclus anynana TaxID=110368 RepID=A0ABM3LJI0_BICAN|nr:two pore channel protein 1-like isoform X6 [Bicyclus anynana]